MRVFLADLWRLLVAPRQHPIYRREQAGWSYVSAWRRLRRGCLPLIAALFAAATLCCGGFCGLTILPQAQLPRDWWLIPFAVTVGVMVAEAVLRFATGLIVTALAATVISAEMEAETYGLLRLTPIPPREIVLAKFSGVMRQVRTPLIALIGVRIGIVGLGIILLAALIVAGVMLGPRLGIGSPPVAPTAPAVSVPLALLYGLTAIGALVTAALLVLYYVIRPVLEALLFAALGMLASSLAKTRASGLISAGALRLGLWMVSYVAGQVVSSLFSIALAPLMAIPLLPVWFQRLISEPAVIILGATLIGLLFLIIIIAAQLGLILALLNITIARANRLPFQE
jgi:hypothetical protein